MEKNIFIINASYLRLLDEMADVCPLPTYCLSQVKHHLAPYLS